MNDGATGFESDRKGREIPYQKYKGRLVVVVKTHGGSIMGVYKGISKEGNMIFNPHESFIYDERGIRKLVLDEDAEIKPELVGEIKPIKGYSSLEEYCRYTNLMEEREEVKRVKEFLENGAAIMGQVGSLHRLK